MKIKTFFSNRAGILLSAVFLGILLLAGTTAAFLFSFRYQEFRRTQNTVSGIPGETPSSSAAPVSSSSSSEPSSSARKSSSAVSGAVETADASGMQIADWRLVLVNDEHKMPENFHPDLVHAFNVDLDARIVEAYRNMHDDARKQDVRLWISSGYRDPERQGTLFEQEIELYRRTGLDYEDAVTSAERSVARAGYSEHNTGLAVDLNGVKENFGETDEFRWLGQHAAEYGFILRYPKDKQEITKIKYEPWHFRYVGPEHAEKMKERNQCLEEYVAELRQNRTAGD